MNKIIKKIFTQMHYSIRNYNFYTKKNLIKNIIMCDKRKINNEILINKKVFLY